MFRHLDPLAVEQTITDWLTALGLPAPEQLTVDGQTLRALAAEAVPASHLVSLFAPATRRVLAQVLVPNKGHEQAALTTLRSRVLLAGHTVSFDALHTHRAVCQAFAEAGAVCVAPVRGNQPTLERDPRNLFGDWPQEAGEPPPWLQAEIQAAGGRWAEHVQVTGKPQHGRHEWQRVCTWTDPRWPRVLGIAREEGQPWAMVHQKSCASSVVASVCGSVTSSKWSGKSAISWSAIPSRWRPWRGSFAGMGHRESLTSTARCALRARSLHRAEWGSSHPLGGVAEPGAHLAGAGPGPQCRRLSSHPRGSSLRSGRVPLASLMNRPWHEKHCAFLTSGVGYSLWTSSRGEL